MKPFNHLPFLYPQGVRSLRVGRLFGHLTIVLMFIGSFAQAQDAFYVYRNDGDFNGFFYDEVKSMSYSRYDLDSVEQDEWVMYDIMLEDTIYRIPLAAIDSIGFQQPEIRFNPKVKFIDKDGYAPYIVALNSYHGCNFADLPASMTPQVGDVFIGLPTDSKAEELYGKENGSFAFVVDELDGWTYPDGNRTVAITQCRGHQIDKISDVFEQFITVEQIGVDKQGNVRRRIAGCTSDGMPRKVATASGTGDLNLFDISFNLTREWLPGGDDKVDLSAEIKLKDKMRAAYDITWKKFFVKLTNELTTRVKPSLGLQLNKSYEATSDDWASLPHVMFPAACPIFETNPTPMFFFRADGTLEARLNLPAVQLGLATDFILDSQEYFPVSFLMHMVPDESAEVDDEMLDISTSVTLKGMVQMGIKFQLNVATANWFKKILMTDLGLHLYCGPKLEGRLSMSADLFNDASEEDVYPTNAIYTTLKNSYINFSFLSIDLEAKAKATGFWGDPVEKKFFDANYSMLCDTLHLAPTFDPITVDYDSTTFEATVHLHPHKGWIIGGSRIQLGMRTTYDRTFEKVEPIINIGPRNNDTVVDYTLENIRWEEKTYHFISLVRVGSFPPVRGDWELYWNPSLYFEADQDSLTFGAKDNLKKTVNMSSNATMYRIHYFGQTIPNGWFNSYSYETEALDDSRGSYCLKLEATPNKTVFDRETFRNDSIRPALYVRNIWKNHFIGMYQPAPDLSNVTLNMGASFKDDLGKTRTAEYHGKVTVTPNGKDFVHVEGTYVDASVANTTKTYTVSMDFKRTHKINAQGQRVAEETEASGTITYHFVSNLGSTKKEIRTEATFGNSVKGTTSGANGPLTSGTHMEWEDDSQTVNSQMSTAGSVNFTLTAN